MIHEFIRLTAVSFRLTAVRRKITVVRRKFNNCQTNKSIYDEY